MLQFCSRMNAVKTFIQLPYFDDIKLAIYICRRIRYSFLQKLLVDHNQMSSCTTH